MRVLQSQKLAGGEGGDVAARDPTLLQSGQQGQGIRGTGRERLDGVAFLGVAERRIVA